MRPLHLVVFLLAACQPLAQPAEEPVREALAMASPRPSSDLVGPAVTFGSKSVPVEVADTHETRARGLSGRESLPPGTGLVLMWQQPTNARIWMPDMNFAIDVVFVRNERVVYIHENAQPCPPEGPCPTFGPDMPVNYVLEVPAGSVAQWELKVGDTITLTRPER